MLSEDEMMGCNLSYRPLGQAPAHKPKPETRNHSHYYKPVGHLQQLDWYRVASLFEITCPALAHAGKKIAFAGKRGAKDQRRDIQEAIDTLLRKLQMMDEDEKA